MGVGALWMAIWISGAHYDGWDCVGEIACLLVDRLMSRR